MPVGSSLNELHRVHKFIHRSCSSVVTVVFEKPDFSMMKSLVNRDQVTEQAEGEEQVEANNGAKRFSAFVQQNNKIPVLVNCSTKGMSSKWLHFDIFQYDGWLAIT